MTTITAKIIADSQSPFGPRLTTMQLRYPRNIHSELMTHRVFSRCASSSRAVPVARLIQDVLDDPAVPLFWGSNKPGMQAGEECNEPVRVPTHTYAYFWPREDAWLLARDNAILFAREFAAAGYAKQIVNRLLEPFSHINVVVSSTAWRNFFALRDHPAAEPHMQMLARAMRAAMDESEPVELRVGDWHLPYVTYEEQATHTTVDCAKLSVARCASVSYKTVEGEPMTMERAHLLHDKLVNSVPAHASPLEHVACVDDGLSHDPDSWLYPEQHRNFVGFRQYRAMVEA